MFSIGALTLPQIMTICTWTYYDLIQLFLCKHVTYIKMYDLYFYTQTGTRVAT